MYLLLVSHPDGHPGKYLMGSFVPKTYSRVARHCAPSRALAAAATAGGGPVQLAEFGLPSPQLIRPIDLSDAIPASRLNPYSWRQPGPTPGCWRILDLHPYILPVHPRARAARAAAHARHPQASARARARAHITSALLTSYRRLIQRWIYGHYGFSLNPSTPRS